MTDQSAGSRHPGGKVPPARRSACARGQVGLGWIHLLSVPLPTEVNQRHRRLLPGRSRAVRPPTPARSHPRPEAPAGWSLPHLDTNHPAASVRLLCAALILTLRSAWPVGVADVVHTDTNEPPVCPDRLILTLSVPLKACRTRRC